jgi:hypothetical protein
MATQKHRKPVNASSRPKLGVGLANVLAQSEIVARAFGPRLGFVLMSMAILASAAVTAGMAIAVAKGLGRVFG